MPTKFKLSGVAAAIRWWKGPPVLVIVPCPPEPAIQLSTEKASGRFEQWVPKGPVAVRPLTNTEKRFLLKKGMHPGLFEGRRVFAVSDEAEKRLNADRKSLIALAKKCGVSVRNLHRIQEAGRRLSAFRPSNFNERRAAVKLQKLLAPEPLKKQRGRPGLTAQDRVQMHADAQQLKHEGMSTDEVVRALAQRYEVRLSYARRILEDASQSKRSR